MGSVVHKYVWYSCKVLNEQDILFYPFVERKDTIVCSAHRNLHCNTINLHLMQCSIIFPIIQNAYSSTVLFKPKLCVKRQLQNLPIYFQSQYYLRVLLGENGRRRNSGPQTLSDQLHVSYVSVGSEQAEFCATQN